MLYAGIDAGSRAIKIVLLDADNLSEAASGCVAQGVQSEQIVMDLLDQLINEANADRSDIKRMVATGYARGVIGAADTTITEITCHAHGVHHLVPDARTIIEIGGQDSKLLRLDADGSVRDFAMNDRCAAGTGRFLEVVAERLGLPLDSLGEVAARSKRPAAISSTCIVFAESEIIGLLASGTPPEDIIAGVQSSIATRVRAMIGRSVTPPVVFTGGVAMLPGMASALEDALGEPVSIVPRPQFTGALGAAILASK